MERAHSDEIADRAHDLFFDGDDVAMETYLRDELQQAQERGDVASVVEALHWLSATVFGGERRQESIEYAREAYELSSNLNPLTHVKVSMTLGLMLSHQDQTRREAEAILTDLKNVIEEAGLGNRLEDMRLCRLAMLYEKSGRVDEAEELWRKIEAMRRSDEDFRCAR